MTKATEAGLSGGVEVQQERLERIVDDSLRQARELGASAAEAGAMMDSGLGVTVRLGEVETIEHTRDHSLGVTVYFGRRKGSASTSDLSPEAVRDTVSAACKIARFTTEDPFAGLAEEDRMARAVPDLDLHHPWPIDAETAIGLGKECEGAARSLDARITNSEGATVDTQSGIQVYGNTHGFVGGYPSTRHSVSCSVIAQEQDSMQRDYWYTVSRTAEQLESVQDVGRRAAERALSRLGARKVSTRRSPVIFRSDIAPSLLRSFVGAINGASLYRRSSFLVDRLGSRVFPEFVRISEDPLLPGGLASAPFDSEGVATSPRDIVSSGVLQGYALDSYSARKLGMTTTGNAGGVRNLSIDSGEHDLDGLLKEMGTGFLVTELMGHGVNLVTGDYSRGSAGFWVEDGEIQFPVEEVTIAGNLQSMFQSLIAVGNDLETRGSIRTGSWLVDGMTLAGD